MEEKVNTEKAPAGTGPAKKNFGSPAIDAGRLEATQETNPGGNLPVLRQRKSRLGDFISRLPSSLPAFSDPAQGRAGGNIVKFLALLLALTLISRGTSGATLARVELFNPARNVIVEAVTGSATVSARDTLDISVAEGLTVAETLVGVGQKVQNGDALVRFAIEEVEEKLTRETANLSKLLQDLARLERREDTDAASLENAQRNLERAREDCEKVKAQGKADVAAAQEALNELKAKQAEEADPAAQDNARRNLERAQEDYAGVKAQGEADVAAAQEALDKAQWNASYSVDAASLETAQRNLGRAREDYESVKAQGEADVTAAQSALGAAQGNEEARRIAWENAPIEDKDTAEQAYRAAQAETEKARLALEAAQSKAQDNLTTVQRRVEDAQIALAKAENDYYQSSLQTADSRQTDIERAEAGLETAEARAEDNLTSAARRVEDAQIALEKAKTDYLNSLEKAADTLQGEIERAEEALKAAQSKAEDNLQSAERRVEDAQVSLARAQQDYNKASQQALETAEQNSISAVLLRLDLEKQKDLVDKLAMIVKNGGMLYTDLEGTISTIKPEGSVTSKDPLISFTDGAKGFRAQLKLEKTEAAKLTVGEECKVTTGGGSMYYTPVAAATIAAIAPPDENDWVQVTILLPDGEWNDGQKVDAEVIQSRSEYNLCVPLSALHSDNSGYYLFTMEQKSTVLGIENTVVKVPVTINAADENMASVQGPLDRNSQVITGSSKAVAAGDRVRVSTQ